MDIYDFGALVLSELYGYSTPLKTFLVKNKCSFHRPMLIFQPSVDSSASNKQKHAVSGTILVSCFKYAIAIC